MYTIGTVFSFQINDLTHPKTSFKTSFKTREKDLKQIAVADSAVTGTGAVLADSQQAKRVRAVSCRTPRAS